MHWMNFSVDVTTCMGFRLDVITCMGVVDHVSSCIEIGGHFVLLLFGLANFFLLACVQHIRY